VAFTETAVGGPTVPASCASVTLSGGTATCNVVVGLVSTLPTIHAVYSGDSNFTGSFDSADATITSVGAAATRVFITAATNPVVQGEGTTFTATVVPTAPGSGAPPGTLAFTSTDSLDCTNLVSNAGTLVNGSLTCVATGTPFTVANSPVPITATYTAAGGVPAYTSGSTSTFLETVTQDTTITNLIVSPKRVLANGPMTLTAIVISPPPSSGTVTGEVSFLVLGKHTGPITCTGGTANSQNVATLSSSNEATCTISSVPAAASPLKITVSYYGDSNYSGSSVSKTVRLH
jgi:hypothetical protein